MYNMALSLCEHDIFIVIFSDTGKIKRKIFEELFDKTNYYDFIMGDISSIELESRIMITHNEYIEISIKRDMLNINLFREMCMNAIIDGFCKIPSHIFNQILNGEWRIVRIAI